MYTPVLCLQSAPTGFLSDGQASWSDTASCTCYSTAQPGLVSTVRGQPLCFALPLHDPDPLPHWIARRQRPTSYLPVRVCACLSLLHAMIGTVCLQTVHLAALYLRALWWCLWLCTTEVTDTPSHTSHSSMATSSLHVLQVPSIRPQLHTASVCPARADVWQRMGAAMSSATGAAAAHYP